MMLSLIVSLLSMDATPLPAPTGPHKVGRMSFHWQDAGREELETAQPGDKRELMVHVFYPADASAQGEPAVYVPDADQMLGPWKEEQIARIKDLRTHSIENAPLNAGNERLPALVFSPGGGMKGLTYHALLEDLASHGWVVAAIDPPYNARAVRFPDGRVLGNLKDSQKGWPQPKSREENVRFYQERIVHWAGDVRFVIDKLIERDKGDGPFADRLDFEKGVGVLGHSRGGQAAGIARLLDDRVRGGINIDGTAGESVVLPVKGPEIVGDQPFLWIQKSLPPPPTEEQLKRAGRTRAEYDAEVARILDLWKKGLARISGGAMRVCMERPDIDHIDFSDERFWDGTMTDENLPGRRQTIAETRAWIRAFFDGVIRGQWDDLKRLSIAAQPNVPVHVFGQMWP